MGSPEFHLVEGSAGSGKTGWCVNECNRLLQNDRSIRVILPSQELVKEFRNRLIKSPGFKGSLTLNLDTLYPLVKTLAGDLNLMYEELNPARLMLVLEHYLDSREDEYPTLFGHEITTGYLEALLEYFRDLHDGAVTAGNLRTLHEQLPDDRESARLQELHRLYLDFSTYLLEHNFTSREQLFGLVNSQLADSSSLLEEEVLIVDGFYDFHPVQRQLLQQLFHQAEAVRFTLLCGEERVFQFTDDTRNWVEQCAEAYNGTVTTLRRSQDGAIPEPEGLFAREAGPDSLETAALIEASGELLEEQEIVRRTKRALIEEGTPPGEIAVIHRGDNSYQQRLITAFRRERIPVAGVVERPLSANPAVAALLRWYEVLGSGFAREEVTGWFDSAYVLPDVTEPERFGGRIRGLANRAQIVRGRDDWLGKIETHLQRQRKRSRTEGSEEGMRARERRKFLQDQQVGGEIQHLWDQLPEFRTATWREHIEDLREVIRLMNLRDAIDFTESAADLDLPHGRDARALMKFMEFIDELEALDSQLNLRALSTAEFSRHLRRLLRNQAYPQNIRLHDGVSVLSVEEARGRSWQRVFVAGMVDERFPVRRRTHPLVSYKERKLLNRYLPEDVSIPEHGAEMSEERLLFYQAITRARGHLTLSTVAGQEDTSVSPFYEEFLYYYSLEGAEPELHRMPIVSIAGDAFPPEAERSWLKADLYPHVLHMESGESGSLPVNLPHLKLLERAVLSREGPEFTVYDGVLQDPVLLESLHEHVHGEERRISPSQLETYFISPFQYFCRYQLGLEEVEEVLEELPPADRGQLMHTIMERFYTELKSEGMAKVSPGEADAHFDRLDRIINEVCEEYQQGGPPLPRLLWESELEQIKDHVRNAVRFFAEEEPWNRPGIEPDRFEFMFGNAGEPDFSLDIGEHAIAFRGRVDRMDVDRESGDFIVVDYKTSRGMPNKAFFTGEVLQLPIYALAARHLIPEYTEPIRLSYYVFRSNEEHGKLDFQREDRHEYFNRIEELVANAVAGITAGWFQPVEGLCNKYCPVQNICRCDQNRIRMKQLSRE